MPYALFCNDAKLSKTYPTEADVWKVARKSGLVIDVVSEEAKAAPRPVLDNDYEIRPCSPDPHEDVARLEGRRIDLFELLVFRGAVVPVEHGLHVFSPPA